MRGFRSLKSSFGTQAGLGGRATLASIDIGATKMSCQIVRSRAAGGFTRLGHGYQLAAGIGSDGVVDIDEAVTAISAVIHEAEQSAGETIREAVITTSCCSPQSKLVRAQKTLDGRALTEDDIADCLRQSAMEAVGPGQRVLHALPVEITIDGGRPLRDPRGLTGDQVEVLACLVLVDQATANTLVDCIERCHLDVKALMAAPYVAGIGCLSDDEVERGCLMIDLGGGMTDIALFHKSRLVLVDQVPYGGNHVTSDLAYVLDTSAHHAERIKNLFGSVQWRSCDDNRRISVARIGDHADQPTGEVARTQVTQITRARIEEIFNMVQEKLTDAWNVVEPRAPRHVVLTGGACQLDGLVELAEEMFGLPTRIGRPSIIHDADGAETEPCCSAVTGALALSTGDDGGLSEHDIIGGPVGRAGLSRLGRWIWENFR